MCAKWNRAHRLAHAHKNKECVHALLSCVCMLTSLPGDGKVEYSKPLWCYRSNDWFLTGKPRNLASFLSQFSCLGMSSLMQIKDPKCCTSFFKFHFLTFQYYMYVLFFQPSPTIIDHVLPACCFIDSSNKDECERWVKAILRWQKSYAQKRPLNLHEIWYFCIFVIVAYIRSYIWRFRKKAFFVP